jgi:hypothetical protein
MFAVTRTPLDFGGGSPSSLAGMPTLNLKGLYFAAEFDATRKAIPNKVIGGTIPPVLTRNPRGVFATGKILGASGSGGWLNAAGLAITEKYAAGRDGNVSATRAVFTAATAAFLRYRQALSLPAGTYTMVIDAWMVSGSQDFAMSRDGFTTVHATFTATATKQQFKYEFTLGSTTSVTLGFCKPVSGAALDIIVDKAFLWRGAAATVPSDVSLGGHLYLGNSELDSISCIGGELALTTAQQGSLDFDSVSATNEATILACVKRTGDYLTAGLGRQPFLYTPIEGTHSLSSGLGLGDIDAEGFSMASHGSASRSVKAYASALAPTGTCPNLFAEANYHVMWMRSKSTGIAIGVDDCGLALAETSPPATASPTLNWWKMVMAGNVGLARHKVNSIAVYDRCLNGVELQQAVAALKSQATADGLTVNQPKNYVLACGDSIMAGPASNSFAQVFIANSTGTGFCLYNIEAVGGSTLTGNVVNVGLNLDVRLPYHLDGIPADLTGRRAIATFMFGANDLDANTVPGYLSTYYSLTNQLRAKGVKIGICTPLPKKSTWPGSAAFNVKQVALAAQLRLDVGTFFDFLIDFDTSGFNAETDTSDGLHPTGAIHASKLEPVYRAAVNAQLI